MDSKIAYWNVFYYQINFKGFFCVESDFTSVMSHLPVCTVTSELHAYSLLLSAIGADEVIVNVLRATASACLLRIVRFHKCMLSLVSGCTIDSVGSLHRKHHI